MELFGSSNTFQSEIIEVKCSVLTKNKLQFSTIDGNRMVNGRMVIDY